MLYLLRQSLFLFIIGVTLCLPLSAGDDCCATRYPILLVHGIALSADSPGLTYWGTMPDRLRNDGAQVYLSGQNLYASHKENARILKKRVIEILKESGAEKINIIAHSKGGIESRYLISGLDMGSRVASLTTLCTPHRGSAIAEIMYELMAKNIYLAMSLAGGAAAFAAISGDDSAAPWIAGAQLQPEYMKTFNAEVPDDPRVYYQSYAAVIKEKHDSVLYSLLHKELTKREGPNDGLVSVQSARWGNYKGIISAGEHSSFSHGDIVCVPLRNSVKEETVYAFYRSLVHDLKERGF